MAYWKRLVIDGKEISLKHLEPFRFELMPDVSLREFTIEVTFNNHCFNETYDPKRHKASLPTSHSDRHGLRAFNERRYELSQKMPEIIRQLSGKRIAQTRNGTLVRVSLDDGVDYAIYFNLRKMNTELCKMYVVSAYPLEPGQRNRVVATGEMKFEVAVRLVMRGKAPKFPPHRKLKL